MDYYQGVVEEYLTRDRSFFVNPEFFLPLEAHHNGLTKGTSWNVDLLTLDLKHRACYLCEVSYSKSLASMLKRLRDWSSHWDAIRKALTRDIGITEEWQIRPWVFAPEDILKSRLPQLQDLSFSPKVKVTSLEMTAPWTYDWNRKDEREKPSFVPSEMS